MSRAEANRKILTILTKLVSKHPDMRFHQLLASAFVNLRSFHSGAECMTVVQDEFYLESEVLLSRVKESPLLKKRSK